MKLLLDENLPVDLRHEVAGHDCETVTFRGWNGLKNGQLLATAATAGFEALLSQDRGLMHQQNKANLPMAVVVLTAPTNKLEDLRPLLPKLLATLETLPPRQVTVID
ncbi:MAG: DUF5615 family PIN-like protein [Planctomycetota bacterium]